jgi:hypothetical protein
MPFSWTIGDYVEMMISTLKSSSLCFYFPNGWVYIEATINVFKKISLQMVSCYSCIPLILKTHLRSRLFFVFANMKLKLASKILNLPSATNRDDSIHKPNLYKTRFFLLYTLHGCEIHFPLALATLSIIEVRGLGLGTRDLSSSLMCYDTSDILNLYNLTSCSCDARNSRSWGAQN